MVVISSTLMAGPITAALDEEGKPTGDGGAALERAFPRFAADLEWWVDAGRAQRERQSPPY
jgi:LDH2 family malate/lactate/ureidoglycolate dehydrogenase